MFFLFLNPVLVLAKSYDYEIKRTFILNNLSNLQIKNNQFNIKSETFFDSPYQRNTDVKRGFSISDVNISLATAINKVGIMNQLVDIKYINPKGNITYQEITNVHNTQANYDIEIKSLDNIKYTNDYSQYLLDEPKIQSTDRPIIDKAKEVVGNEQNPYLKAKSIFAYVNTNIQYDSSEGNKGALNALRTKKGLCEDYADLFVTMARAVNIPARVVYGYWVASDAFTIGESYNMTVGHAWAEFYLPNYGWIFVDPTPTKDNRQTPDWDYFAKDNDTHLVSGYQSPETLNTMLFLENMFFPWKIEITRKS